MTITPSVYLGIDCGATTSKVGGVDANGRILSQTLRQNPTRSELGSIAILDGWMQAAAEFLASIGKTWEDVAAVGLAIPGPYLDYGVLGKMANMPPELTGWPFLRDLKQTVDRYAGRDILTTTANDGLLAGVAEANIVQRKKPGSVVMFAPGSGLGCSFIDAEGGMLHGDHQAGVIFCHMPAPFEQLGLPKFSCGCGREWGCYEAYTSISGLPQMLAHFLPDFPDHPLACSKASTKSQVLSLRDLARDGDPLALRIFDTQAQALGLAVAAACMAYDPTHIIIGGGLMDRGATTPQFRQNYINSVRSSAAKYMWVDPDCISYSQASLGELSQAIGAALYALRQCRQ